MGRGKNEAQTFEEMTSAMIEAKANGLEKKRGQSIYKRESGEYQEEKLRDLITCSTRDLVEASTKEKVSLEDVNEVKARSIIYLRACQETGTFPGSLGLARALGYSDRALRHWRETKRSTKTAQYLEMFNDLCSDILSQSALKKNASEIMAIFLNKSQYGMRETSEIVVSPKNTLDDEEFSVDEIRKRYLHNDEYIDVDNTEKGGE